MKRMHLMLMAILLSWFASAQINSNAAHTSDDHTYEVIAYVPQWDAWKMVNGQQRALNHFNIDYSQYTILNFSFFGVAQDGSLHSADLRNPQIYQSSQVQQPAALLHPDPTSSHDQALVLGTQTTFWSWNADLIQYGYQARTDCGYSGCGWIDTASGQQGVWPLNVTTGPSLIDLGHQAGKKVMASIGGWSMSKHFPEMAADPVKRATFISGCQNLINQYGFDGIDLDWEYPGARVLRLFC